MAHEATLTGGDRAYFWLKRLHSLSGIVPIGLFLCEHLITNSLASRGPETYNTIIETFSKAPFFVFLELTLIISPILFHGIYGLFITRTAQSNALRYGYFRNWMYTLQRVTGVIVFFFVLWHLWHFRIAQILYGTEVSYERVAEVFSAHPLVFWGYALGVYATIFHFSNGIWSFLITWGVTVGERAQRYSAYLSAAVFILLGYVGYLALTSFH